MPLNQGCLAPVRVIVPKGTILDPTEGAAVVGGNVLTSQRIVDVVLKAFQVSITMYSDLSVLKNIIQEYYQYKTA